MPLLWVRHQGSKGGRMAYFAGVWDGTGGDGAWPSKAGFATELTAPLIMASMELLRPQKLLTLSSGRRLHDIAPPKPPCPNPPCPPPPPPGPPAPQVVITTLPSQPLQEAEEERRWAVHFLSHGKLDINISIATLLQLSGAAAAGGAGTAGNDNSVTPVSSWRLGSRYPATAEWSVQLQQQQEVGVQQSETEAGVLMLSMSEASPTTFKVAIIIEKRSFSA